MIEVSSLGVLSALVVTIALILKKVPPAYGMLFGAMVLDHMPVAASSMPLAVRCTWISASASS